MATKVRAEDAHTREKTSKPWTCLNRTRAKFVYVTMEKWFVTLSDVRSWIAPNKSQLKENAVKPACKVKHELDNLFAYAKTRTRLKLFY